MSSFQAGIVDGMHKVSAEDERHKQKKRKRALIAAGAGLGAAALTAGILTASRPALRKNLAAYVKGLGRGGSPGLEHSSKLPQSVRQQSRDIAVYLQSKGIDPAKARIGISGTGGAGKSTLARGIADELGMRTKTLDDVARNAQGRDFTRYFKKNPVPAGYIAEQTHLLTQVDPDKFDAIIRVHKPMSTIQQQILSRGRGAAQLDVYNYEHLGESIRTAFEATRGKVKSISSNIDIKVKPDGGFRAGSELNKRVMARGLSVPSGASREDLVYAATRGHMPLGGGVVPYIRKGRIAGAVGAIGASGAGGSYAANQAWKRHDPE